MILSKPHKISENEACMIHSFKQYNLGIEYFGANTGTQKLFYNENQINVTIAWGVAYLSHCVTHSAV